MNISNEAAFENSGVSVYSEQDAVHPHTHLQAGKNHLKSMFSSLFSLISSK